MYLKADVNEKEKSNLSNLDGRAQEGIMVGDVREARGYKLWDAALEMMVMSRDVLFDESMNESTCELCEIKNFGRHNISLATECLATPELQAKNSANATWGEQLTWSRKQGNKATVSPEDTTETNTLGVRRSTWQRYIPSWRQASLEFFSKSSKDLQFYEKEIKSKD